MSKWQPIETMPEGVKCMTRIFDADGERNIQPLTKRTREPGKTAPLYWAGEMYVYYEPTHWMALPANP